MYLRQVGVVPILSCMEKLSCGVLGLLKVSVSAMLATVRCSDIYRDIPTWVPRCRCYVSVTERGATATDGTVSLQSTVCYLLGNTWRVRDYLD